ncbi:MAG: FTR1 family protein [Chloroflexi bacterium]|uniref:iron uptake transporter permease EfeU n=1 Tax=Candidatus Flexifilum breve TaxID=3140694 RepID=UPI003135D448|nr:FTR1 family protein [Chloroflexota bacterium]
MIAPLLIALREGLEASLIVGIVLSYLRKTNQMRYQRYAWAGVLAAIAVSVLVALGIQAVGAELEGRAEEIFEGVMMLIAVAVLTWMIFWMRSQARTLKGSLETELAAVRTSPRGLFSVTFFAVVREGVEMALLLAATAFTINGQETLIGSLIGLAVAALIGALVYASSIRLNLRHFFSVTSVLLLLFAAGMFASALHEFQEAGLLPTIIEQVWDTNGLLAVESPLGSLLKTLFGYNSTPSLVDVIGYAAYWLFALTVMPWLIDRSLKAKAQADTVPAPFTPTTA